MDETSQLNVRVPTSLITQARARADDEERTLAALVTRALRTYLARAPERSMAGD